MLRYCNVIINLGMSEDKIKTKQTILHNNISTIILFQYNMVNIINTL